jgi:hypothetical protein
MTIEKKRKMLENIYDIIVKSAFKEEARRELDNFLKNKDVVWCGDSNTIRIGKHFAIKLEE